MESRLYSFSMSMAVLVATAGLLSLAASSSDATPVRIGVVLDLTTETGRKSLACISMALEDFYLEHPSYTTRAELRVRDTRGELAAAAGAVLVVAEELMNEKAYVQAVLAPHVSAAEVELFAASVARRGDIIPILSFSAVSPPASSSRSRARFVLRTAADGGSQQQAAAIAAVLEAFAWRAAVLLHEDSIYGIGILPALVNAFQGRAYRARGVTNSLAVPADATDSRLDAVLVAAKGMPARVYVVHMPPALASRLFRRAMAAGMMSEGYAWIATAGVGGAADSLNPGDTDSMQGVLSLRPRVQATDHKLRNFSRRFEARYFRQDMDDALHHRHRTATPVWLLWLYDTAWAAATAAEVSFGRTTTQGTTTLADALLHTEFDGLAGRFKLIDGQLQVSAYEIVNTVGEGGGRTVGFWTPESGITTSLHPKISGNALKQILWPGETAVTPVGWSESPGGRPLRVAVPVKSGFRQFVDVSGQTITERVMGYCIDVFHEVMTTKLAYSVAYEYVMVNNSAASTYDALVNLVHEKNADVLVGDVTITASRMKLVSFTMPFTDSGWSMIVAKEDLNNNMWIFLKPLTLGLWLTSLAFFFTGLVVWVIEHGINPQFRGTAWKQFGVIFYFAFSTLVFSHKEKLESNLSKMVVIIWVFVVLILTTSYTANLSTMLTVGQLQPTINLLGGRDYVGYQHGSFIAGLLKEMGFDEARLRGYNTMEEYADALKKGSKNGGVTAIFAEVPYLRLFLSRYDKGYNMIGPTYKSGGFGFVFPLGSPLAQDVSRAILELAEEEKLTLIESRWFGHTGTSVSATAGDDSSAARLDVRSFGGLFLVNAAVSGLVLLAHLIAKFVSRDRGGEVGAGALPWMRAWLRRRRSDALDSPPLGVDQERDRRRVAAGATEEEEAAARGFTSVDTTSMELDAMDSRRNQASSPPASSETSLPPAAGGLPPPWVGGGSIEQPAAAPRRRRTRSMGD